MYSATNNIDRLTFNTETITELSSKMSVAKSSGSGFANSGTAGYFAGGNGYSNIEKISFTTESQSTIGATLSGGNRYGMSGFANSGTAGYVAGGFDSSGYITKIEKTIFSNDTNSNLAGTLSQRSGFPGGLANSGASGYSGGGYQIGGPTANINRVVFSTDTVSLLAAKVLRENIYGDPAGVSGLAGAANSGSFGYFAAGEGFSVITKLTFSNNTTSNIATTFPIAETGYFAGAADSGVAAYFAGGQNPQRSTIRKITFSNDTVSTLSSTLSRAASSITGFANTAGL
jgi:hypothetical protein